MSAFWLLAAFAAGWLACGWLSRILVKAGFQSNLAKEALSGLPQEKLLKVQAIVGEELAARRES